MNIDRDEERLEHVIKHIAKIEKSLANISKDRYLEDDDKKDALDKNLAVIGEACNHLSEDVLSAHPEIPWKDIISLRNRLVHAYARTSYEMLWNIAKKELPLLKVQMGKILEEIQLNSDPIQRILKSPVPLQEKKKKTPSDQGRGFSL